MFKHYCDMCNKEIKGKAKEISIKEKTIEEYSTKIVQTSIVCGDGCVTWTQPNIIGNNYEVCDQCAERIKNMFIAHRNMEKF